MPKYWGGARKPPKKKVKKLVITLASYALQKPPRVAHAKPPGPKLEMSGSNSWRKESGVQFF